MNFNHSPFWDACNIQLDIKIIKKVQIISEFFGGNDITLVGA